MIDSKYQIKYFAHSGHSPDFYDWQILQLHLNNVAQIASFNAHFFKAEVVAYYTGILHDLGKYTLEFQNRLNGSSVRVDHATAGAKIAVESWGVLGKVLAFCIAGHHTGLANGIDEGQKRSNLKSRLNLQFGSDIPHLDSIWTKEIALPQNLEFPKLGIRTGLGGFQLAFFIRMIFSCLVDADFVDTDNFYRQLEKQPKRETAKIGLDLLQSRLNAHLKPFLDNPIRPIHQIRNDILKHIREQTQLPTGLFSLTVPTGGGKTLASMAFALDHALHNHLRRVIYVIPFTSIIEQNAKIFREAFGADLQDAVLEHHSAFDAENLPSKNAKDKLKIAMENWDAPVVVTTAVQFFESLFADKGSKCRKLHNITGSVIVLDEVQTLPLKLLKPIMVAIDELARNYQCSVVLCTATQPALAKEHIEDVGFEGVRELAPNPKELFQKLKRTHVQNIGMQTDEELVAHLLDNQQILMIVNNRRHARVLFDGIKHLAGARHLTTLMCAKHRTQVLNEIREDLKNGKPCRLVSTSLVEAGVDVDFPNVFRAEAGLDSIAQAAGRCNREGKQTAENSVVRIFQTTDEWKAPPELAQLAAGMREVMRNHSGDVLAPDAIESYFKGVYWMKGNELDAHGILKRCENHARTCDFDFENMAKDMKLVESYQRPIIIQWDFDAKKLIRQLEFSDMVGGVARKLQPYTVQIPELGFKALLSAGVVRCIAPDKFGNQFWILDGGNLNENLYQEDSGLSWDNPSFLEAEKTII
jgi:CRISPR-associated endonuclease/helicase Cas3